jgi:tetratricopeptide (TPR) repeat protein
LGQAKEWLEQAQDLFQELGDRRGLALSMTMLGLLMINMGLPEQGEPLAREALAIARDLSDYRRARMAIGILCAALGSSGKFSEALAVMKEDLAIRHDQGMILAEAEAMRALGTTARHLGAYDKARAWAEASSSLSQQSFKLGPAQSELGRLALAEGVYDEAWERLQEALTLYDTASRHVFRGEVLTALGYTARKLARHSQAREYLYTTLQFVAKSRHGNAALQALPAVALLFLDDGAPERAVELYALTSRYPYVANSRWFADIAGDEIAAAAEALPPEVVAAARERGRARDLWTTVEELQEELGRASSG